MLNNKHFEDKAWDQMKGLLDKEMPEEIIPFWKRWYSLLLLLLFIPGSFLIYNYFDNSPEYADNKIVNTETFSLNAKNNISSEAILPLDKKAASQSPVDAYSIPSNEIETNSTELKIKQTNPKLVLQNKADKKQESKILNQHINNTVIPSKKNNSDISFVSKKSINNVELSYANSNSMSNEVNKTSSVASENTSEIISKNELSSTIISTNSDAKSIKRSKFSSGLISPNTIELFNLENPIVSNQDLSETRKYSVTFQVYGATNYISDFSVLSYSIGMETYLKRKYSSWSFGLGSNLEYFNFDNSINLSNKDADLAENFPETAATGSNEVQRVSINRVYQINVPLIINYNVNRFSFGIGLNNSFIIKELYPTLDLNSFSNADKNETYRMSFINSVDYSFTKAISSGLYFRYDLSDFSNGVNTSNKLHAIGCRVSYHFAR